MDSDGVAHDPPIVSVPGRRRAMYTPAPRRDDRPEPAVHGPEPAEHHDDDELASALEEQVSQLTAAQPIIAGPTVVGSDGVTDAASLTDDEIASLVQQDLSSHNTLAAIEHLERVLVARAATTATPVQTSAAALRPERDLETAPETPPTTDEVLRPRNSFGDVDIRPRDEGPEPTFSAWIAPSATAAIVIPVSGPSPEPAPPRPGRVEPLEYVAPEVAPADSQPVPLVAGDVSLIGETAAPRDRDDADSVPEAPAGPPEIVARDTELTELPTGSAAMPVTAAATAAAAPTSAPMFVSEQADLEPTDLDRRVGWASRMFWLWFAATSSLISVGVGATLFTLGLSLRQLLVATLIGVALSFLPLGLGTLAGKWSGQPTMVVSRAMFGMRGNVVPAALALLTRLFWGAVLLWLAGVAAGSLFTSLGWSSDAVLPTTVALVVTIGVALAVAYFGYSLVARVQLILTIASAVLIVVMVAATWRAVDVSKALGVPDAIWLRTVTGALLVFSYLGLAWANSSAEVARYQRRGASGAASMLWATFGAALPAFLLISYGGLLAASNPAIADALATNPVSAFARLGLPAWYPIPMLLAVGLSLISALVLNIYSGGFTLEALGVRLERRWSTVAVGGAIALVGILLATTTSDLASVLRGLPTTLAVPVAAWAGLFSAEMMLRTRRFHQPSLVKRGGVYPDWRWPNLVMLVVASVIGLGLVSSPLPWLRWEGFLISALGLDPQGDLGMSNLGVLVALGLGIVTPLVSGIPAVRRQERASP